MNPAQNSNESPKRGGLVRMVYFFGRLVKRIWLPVIAVLMIMAVYGLSGMIIGHRYSYALRKLKAQGQPISITDLKPPHIPDEQNGAVLYEKAFRIIKDYYTVPSKGIGKAFNMPGMRNAPDEFHITNHNEQASMLDRVYYHERDILLQKKNDAPVNWAAADKESKALAAIMPFVEQALSRPGFDIKLNYSDDKKYSFDIQKMHWESSSRNLIRVLAFQTMVDAHYGRRDQACHTACLALRSSKMFKNQPTLSSLATESACNQMANYSICSLVRNCPLTPSEAAELNRYLLASDHADEVIPAVKNERAVFLSMYLGQRPGNAYGDFWFPDSDAAAPWWSASAVKLLNQIGMPLLYEDEIAYINTSSKMIAIMSAPGKTMRVRRNELVRTVKDIPKYAWISSEWLPFNVSLVDRVMKDRARTALTQVVIAAQQYKQQHGAYPDTLAQLRSNSKLSIPLDPFTDKELVYQRTKEGFLVYSVGQNEVDDGGKTATRQSKDKYDDIVLNWRW